MSKEIDYGILSDISRELNCNLLGDCSGSTISRRTTKGFKKSLNLTNDDISDQNAEHIVHALMIAFVGALVYGFRKNKNEALIVSLVLFLALRFSYKNEG